VGEAVRQPGEDDLVRVERVLRLVRPPKCAQEAPNFASNRGRPVGLFLHVNEDGLLEACRDVAAVVHQELHALPSPLEGLQAIELWHFRHGYLTALLHLGGNRLAKEEEARVSPRGQPLAICLDSTNQPTDVTTIRGSMTMRGYWGCLRTFPDLPFGPGRRWPRLCPSCEPQRSNLKNKAIRELQRRAARLLAPAS
jgi:hypothetical protein